MSRFSSMFSQLLNLFPRTEFQALVNLVPVTIGNLIGGTLLVGAVYWFVYLRPRRES